MGVNKLLRHGSGRSLYDMLGANYTNPSLSNITGIESALLRAAASEAKSDLD